MKKILFGICLLISIFILTGCGGGNKLSDSEAVAWTSLRLATSQSAYDETGTLSESNFDTLGTLCNNWFSSSLGSFASISKDTSNNQVTLITDGTYTATFTVEHDGVVDYKLISCVFEEKSEEGYSIEIE